MAWTRVTPEDLETRTGIVVEVEPADGAVNIRTDGGTWQLRPASRDDRLATADDLKVVLDVRKGQLSIVPQASNSAILHMDRRS